MRKELLFSSGLVLCLLLAGCGGPKSQMKGKYSNQSGQALEVTADKLIFTGPIVSMTLSYTVVKEEGDTVTLEVSPDGKDKKNIDMQVDKSGVIIKNSILFDGRWTRT